jgi:hypothetical protein
MCWWGNFSTCGYQGDGRRARTRADLTRGATLAHGLDRMCWGSETRRFGGGRFANRPCEFDYRGECDSDFERVR